MNRRISILIVALLTLEASTARAELPTGYFVWSKGKAGVASSRKIYRMTLPGKTDEKALTSGEDVSSQISPDGKWVAYAKAKLSSGSDYHAFHLWNIYIVSIHGVGDGREEIKIDSGAWPSWGAKDELYYNQPDKTHSTLIRVTLNADGGIESHEVVLSTRKLFPSFKEVNECFIAPGGEWFAARTRGAVNGVGAYWINPPKQDLLAQAGDIGCMPHVAPSGTWGLIAGSTMGIRWGDAPNVPGRKVDQILIPAKAGYHAYHPGVSSDEKWVMAAQGKEQDHNAGAYDIAIYPLDSATKKVGPEESLAVGGFNGWPDLWIGAPTIPPKPKPKVVDFYPASYTLIAGEKTQLSWKTRSASTVELDGQPVAVPEGTQDVTPGTTTTYTLVATSQDGHDAASGTCTITVNTSAIPVKIVSFKATSAQIEQGQSATLTWSIENATTLDLDGKRVAPTGSLVVEPQKTRDYILTAEGHAGPVKQTVTITVAELIPPEPKRYDDRGGFVCSLASGSTRGESPRGAEGDVIVLLIFLAFLGVLRRGSRRRKGRK